MKEIKGDLFSFLEDEATDAICITTNGMVGADGKAVMGAGTAGEAARRWPTIRASLGLYLNVSNINTVFPIGFIDKDQNYKPNDNKAFKDHNYKCIIFSFPTKNDFRKPAVPELIKESAEALVKYADNYNLNKIVVPAPGCGSFTGKLDWEKDVKPLIKDILDDRFYICFLD